MKRNRSLTKTELKALNSFVKLMRAAESVSTRVHSHLTEAGLTISQFGVLEAIYHLGPLNQKEIGKKILKTSGNITMVIDNLEKRGLVKRSRSIDDRRAFAVELTEKGYVLIESIFPRHAGIIAREFGALSAGEQAELGMLCKKLGLGG